MAESEMRPESRVSLIPLTAEARPALNSWSYPFPSSQAEPSAPPRPPRPLRPAEAQLFSVPASPQARFSTFSGESFDSSVEMDLATFVMMRTPSGNSTRHTSMRKPVPAHPPIVESLPYSIPSGPTTPVASPNLGSTSPASATDAASNRLSLGGFEELLRRGEESVSQGWSWGKGKQKAVDLSAVPNAQENAGRLLTPSMPPTPAVSQRERFPTPTPSVVQQDWRSPDISEQILFSSSAMPQDGVPWRRPSVAAKSGQEREAVSPLGRRSSFQPEEVVEVPLWRNWEVRDEKRAWWDSDEVVIKNSNTSFRAVKYSGCFVHMVYFLYPFCVLAHFPVTLFLDYNAIYILVQLAFHPALPSSALAKRALSVPSINITVAFWVALGVYGICTLIWGVAVFLYRDFGKGYLRFWDRHSEVPISRIYRGAASFNMACIKHYSYFSLLFRVRLAPFQRRRTALSVPGSSFFDGVLETASWYAQNWPTVLLLIPRAGLCTALLLLYGTTAYSTDTTMLAPRDAGYFDPNGVLTTYATIILLINCCWAAWRLLLVVVSIAIIVPFSSSSAAWRTRRSRRLRAAVFLCQSSKAASPRPSPRPDEKVQEHRRRQLAQRGVDDASLHSSHSSLPILRMEINDDRLHLTPSPSLNWDFGHDGVGAEGEWSMPSFTQSTNLPPGAAPPTVGSPNLGPPIPDRPWLRSAFSTDTTISITRELPADPFLSSRDNLIPSSESIYRLPSPTPGGWISLPPSPVESVHTPPLPPERPVLTVTAPTPTRPTNNWTSSLPTEYRSPMRLFGSLQRTSASEADATIAPPVPLSEDVTASTLLSRQLNDGSAERDRLSQKQLLDEITRLKGVDEVGLQTERRLAALSRISEGSRESPSDKSRRSEERDAVGRDGWLLPPFRLSMGSENTRPDSSVTSAFEFDSEHGHAGRQSGSGETGFGSPFDPDFYPSYDPSTPRSRQHTAGSSDFTVRDYEDGETTPTQRGSQRGQHPNRFATVNQSPGGDTFGVKSRMSRIPSPSPADVIPESP